MYGMIRMLILKLSLMLSIFVRMCATISFVNSNSINSLISVPGLVPWSCPRKLRPKEELPFF